MNDPSKRPDRFTLTGVGAAACVACCAAPILGVLGGIGIAGIAGTLLLGAGGLLIAVLVGIAFVGRPRRRSCC